MTCSKYNCGIEKSIEWQKRRINTSKIIDPDCLLYVSAAIFAMTSARMLRYIVNKNGEAFIRAKMHALRKITNARYDILTYNGVCQRIAFHKMRCPVLFFLDDALLEKRRSLDGVH